MLAPNARAALGLAFLLVACGRGPSAEPAVEPAAAKSVARETLDEVVFAIIGDYGKANDQEAQVAALVDRMDPDFVVTVGDNNYVGDYATSVGGYYGEFLPPVPATTGDGCLYDLASVDFYPAPGNHDTNGNDMSAYAGYFPWASQSCSTTKCDQAAEAWINDRYPALDDRFACRLADDRFSDLFYDVVRGPLHLISLNSVCIGESTDVAGRCLARPIDCRGGDWTVSGTGCEKSYCVQLLWMEYAIAQQRSAPRRLVVFHHVPYSTETGSSNASCLGMRYDYGGAGATTVVTGHNHFYQRLQFDGGSSPAFTYFVNGAGGYPESHVCNSAVTPVLNPPVSEAPIPSYLGHLTSAIGYEGTNKNGYGAQEGVATTQALMLRFYDQAAENLRVEYVDTCRTSGGSLFGCGWHTTYYPQAICCGNTIPGAPVACP